MLALAQAPPTTSLPPEPGEALRDLAGHPWTPAVLVIGTLVAAYVLVWLYKRHAGRGRAIAQVAASHGLAYTHVDGSGIGSIRFSSFAGGDAVDVSNTVTGNGADGAVVRVFDFSILVDRVVTEESRSGFRWNGEEVPTDTVRRVPTGVVRTGAAIGVQAYLPRLTVLPETWGTRAVDAVGGRDLQFESEEFNRLFDVRSEDREFARLFLDAAMMTVLLETEGKVGLEVFGNWLLITCPLARPGDFPALLRYAVALRDAVSDLVREMYPDATDAAWRPGFRLGG